MDIVDKIQEYADSILSLTSFESIQTTKSDFGFEIKVTETSLDRLFYFSPKEPEFARSSNRVCRLRIPKVEYTFIFDAVRHHLDISEHFQHRFTRPRSKLSIFDNTNRPIKSTVFPNAIGHTLCMGSTTRKLLWSHPDYKDGLFIYLPLTTKTAEYIIDQIMQHIAFIWSQGFNDHNGPKTELHLIEWADKYANRKISSRVEFLQTLIDLDEQDKLDWTTIP